MEKTYNYREEIDKIIKEKNIVFYDKDFDEGDERRYNISADRLKEIDRLEKKLSLKLNRRHEKCLSPEYKDKITGIPLTSKEYFIETLNEVISDEDLEKKDSKNFLSISDYEFSLNFWIELV